MKHYMQHYQQQLLACLHRQDTRQPLVKVGMVGAGYVSAVALAAAAVACHWIALGSGGRQEYSGMNAFGDGLLFLAVFGVATVPATGTALFFLRPYPTFWRGFSVVALLVALTALAACVEVIMDTRSMLATVAFLRILVAPLCALAFGLSGCFAPQRAFRQALLVASGLEVAGFAGWVISCIVRSH